MATNPSPNVPNNRPPPVPPRPSEKMNQSSPISTGGLPSPKGDKPPNPNRMTSVGTLHTTKRMNTAMKMLGIDAESEFDLPDEMKQQSLVIPPQLEDTGASDHDIAHLYEFHLPTSKVLEKHQTDQSLQNKKKMEQVFYQLVFDIRHCIFKAGNDTYLLFSIFDDKSKQFITEEYCLNLSVNNFPKKGSPEECKVLFKNLSDHHIKSDLYVICRIYREGPMEAPNVLNTNAKPSNKKESIVIRPYGVTVIPLKNHIQELVTKIGKEKEFEPGTAPIQCPKEDSGFIALPSDLMQLKKTNSYVAPMSIGIAHSFTLYKGTTTTVEENYKEFKALTMVSPIQIDPVLDEDRHQLYITLHETHVDQRRKRSQCNVKCRIELRDNATLKPIPESIQMGQGEMAVPQASMETPVYYHTNDPVILQTYCVRLPEDVKMLETCHLFFSMWHQPKDKDPDDRGFAFLRLYNPKLKQLATNNVYELPIYTMGKKKENYLDNPTILKQENKVVKIQFNLQSTKILPDNDIHRFLTWRHQPVEPVIQAVKRVAKKPFAQLLTILDDLMKAIFEIMLESTDEVFANQTFAALVSVFGDVNKGINEKYRDRIEKWIETRFRYPKIWRSLALHLLTLLQWIASDEAVESTSKDADSTLRQRGAEKLRQLQHAMRGVKYLFRIMKRSCDLEVEAEPGNKNKVLQDYNAQIAQLFASLNKMMGLSHQQVAGVQSYAIRNFLALTDSLSTEANTSIKLVTKVEGFVNSIQNSGVLNNVEKLLLVRRFLEHPQLERKDIFESLFPKLFKMLHFHLDGSIDEKLASFTLLQKCVDLIDITRPRRIKDPRNEFAPVDHVDDGQGLELTSVLMDNFAALMLKMFAVYDEIRRTDLATVVNIQRIFGRQFKKNPNNKGNRDRSHSVSVASEVSQDQLEVHREFCVTLADLARQVTGRGNAMRSWAEKSDRVDKEVSELRKASEDEAVYMIESVLKCCNNLLHKTVFPQPWVHMRMVEAELGMRGLSWFASTLQKNYLQKFFKKDLWEEWLSLGMTFLSNDDFSLEDLEEERADIITHHYGDVRNLAIEKISAAWDVLTPHRSDLADTMISSAVAASASDVSEIQEFAVDVYFQMMKSEFETTSALKTVETYTIDQVDQLTAKYSNKDTIINRYLDFFRVHVRKKLESSNTRLKKMGETFITEIEKLYEYLVQLKKLPSEKQYEDERTSATLSLLEYLDLTQKDELFNRYIHHLALMHQQLKNYVEAANCFKKHADRLGWSETILKAEPQIELDEMCEYKRHIKLAELSHRYYVLGDAWEMGVRVCQELAHVYETKLYDLVSLSGILEKQSQLWKFIAQQDRVFHSCYLVSFRGDFPGPLKNEQYIFRSGNGKYPEPVRDFTARVKEKWDKAKVANSSDPIPEEYEKADFEGQFIRITTLTPSSTDEAEGREFKWDATNAPLKLKKYYRENETNAFYYTYQKKIPKAERSSNEFRDVWITRVFVITADIIPALRRRIPVIKEIREEFTPLATAVNSLVEKNKTLQKIIITVQDDVKHDIKDISMQLNGVLDAAVMGGVAKYREAFFDGSYMAEFPSEAELGPKFKEALKSQMIVAEEGLVVYEKYCPENLRAHTEHLRGCLSKMQKDMKEFLQE